MFMNIKQPIMLKDQVMRNNRPQVCTISSFTVGTLETFLENDPFYMFVNSILLLVSMKQCH